MTFLLCSFLPYLIEGKCTCFVRCIGPAQLYKKMRKMPIKVRFHGLLYLYRKMEFWSSTTQYKIPGALFRHDKTGWWSHLGCLSVAIKRKFKELGNARWDVVATMEAMQEYKKRDSGFFCNMCVCGAWHDMTWWFVRMKTMRLWKFWVLDALNIYTRRSWSR